MKIRELLIIAIVASIFSPNVSLALNLDNLAQEESVKISESSIEKDITKELLFSVLGKRFKNQKRLFNKYNELELPNHSDILAFDNKGKIINTGSKKKDFNNKSGINVGRKFVFTTVLSNSYNYKPKGGIGYVSDEFRTLVGNLVSYYRYDAENNEYFKKQSLESISKTLKSWKKGKFNEKSYGKITNPLLAFANDYDKFIEGLSGDFTAKKKDKEKQLAQQKADKEQSNKVKKNKKINALINKHASTKLSKKLLKAQVITYAGASISGELTTFVELIDTINGTKEWEFEKNIIILRQQNKDKFSGENHQSSWLFKDTHKKDKRVFLERVILDGKEYPTSQLIYLVLQAIGN